MMQEELSHLGSGKCGASVTKRRKASQKVDPSLQLAPKAGRAEASSCHPHLGKGQESRARNPHRFRPHSQP